MAVGRRKRDTNKNPADFVQAQLDIPNDSGTSTAPPPSEPTASNSEQTRPQLIQIQKYTCKACDFKGNLGEVQRHEQEKHQITGIFQEKKKRPIPNLIPIQSQKPQPRQGELTKENVERICGSGTFKDLASLVSEGSSLKEPPQSKSPDLVDPEKKIDSFKKKNASFFDKLKEKLMTSANLEGTLNCTFCGHESKCLSEHMKHQKSHIPGERDDQSESSFGSQGVPALESTSTRCQHCRHRCKSSSDLTLHLQTCQDAPRSDAKTDDKSDDESVGPHPMENKVFVWNTLSENSLSAYHSDDFPTNKSPPPKEEKAFVGIEVKPGYGTTTNGGQEETITSKDVNTKKVFKCPHCSFWASTASRFHVHIVGHLNKRPFQCSLCHYSSNWRWDITKHIRLKTIRDPSHEKAKVLLTDETGRRNYSKYNKYLTTMKVENPPAPNKLPRRILPKDQQASLAHSGSKRAADSTDECDSPRKKPLVENKKTMWKCKKCYFRDNDREVVLEHVRDHYRNAADGGKKKKKIHSQPSKTKKDEEEPGENDDKPATNFPCPEYMCETCPFTGRTWHELEAHSEKHFVCTVNGKQYKCNFCSYYAQDNEELSSHLESHGDPDSREPADGKSHACLQCPYVAINKTQLVYHRKRHGVSDSQNSHKCYKCSYSAPNNTILALHVRLHGRHNANEASNDKTSGSKLPADISKVDTTNFPDVPMVWVSKPMGISKMFKCRHCPHLNMRKSNIQEHEKMHRGTALLSSGPQHGCPDCNYICNNAGILASHFKVHQALFGQIVGVVDSSKPDDEQIAEMKERLEQYESSLGSSSKVAPSASSEPDDHHRPGQDNRVLRFCNVCPARFLFEKEMKIHMRFHEMKLLYKCDSCTYTARQKQHLEAHFKVHTDEYQQRTNVLTDVYGTDFHNPRPKIAAVRGSKDSRESVWVVIKEEDDTDEQQDVDKHDKGQGVTKQFSCSKCPAEFFKPVALSYHETLHGGPGPHKCKHCDYAVKTYGNLIRHETVHKNQTPKKTKYDAFVSGADLSKQKTEALKTSTKSPPPTPLLMDPEFGILIHGSPEFTYPTYQKNGKTKEKRYKCHKCPSAFEKREQYKIHLSLHGSRQRYSCERCDYSVKYYANYTQHIKKHDTCDAVIREKKAIFGDDVEDVDMDETEGVNGVERSHVDRCSKTMKMSTADQQALMIMQQRNLANCSFVEKDVVSRCPHCPYTNNRKDGVSSHIRCHSNPRGGPYVCKYCDYTVPQSHFLRDHMKVHFNAPKFVKPDAYMKVEHMEIWAEPLDPTQEDKKFLVFKDQGGKHNHRFIPEVPQPVYSSKGRVYINLRTGEEEFELDDDDKSRRKVNGDTTQDEEEEDDDESKIEDEAESKMGDLPNGVGSTSSCDDSEFSELSNHSKPEPKEVESMED